MRPLLLLLLSLTPAFAGDWSDAYRPRVPCEVQGNAPKIKCEHCGAACPCGECGCAVGRFPRVTAPKCAICGPKCQCVTCGCPKSVTAPATPSRAAALATPFRLRLVTSSGEVVGYRIGTLGEYLSLGGRLEEATDLPPDVVAVVRAAPVVVHPVAVPMPMYGQIPYMNSAPARGVSAGFQFRGPFGGGFSAQACAGGT